MSSPRLALLASVLAACGGSGGANIETTSADGGGKSSAGPAAHRSCTDASGAPAACAVEPQGQECALGDAKDCMTLTTEEVTVGSEGPCLRIVYENRCGQVVYTDTQIEHTTEKHGVRWQGWTSTTLPGAQMDLAQCGATGRYTNVASLSDGKLTTLETQCPKPE